MASDLADPPSPLPGRPWPDTNDAAKEIQSRQYSDLDATCRKTGRSRKRTGDGEPSGRWPAPHQTRTCGRPEYDEESFRSPAPAKAAQKSMRVRSSLPWLEHRGCPWRKESGGPFRKIWTGIG